MGHSWDKRDGRVVRIYERKDELSSNLAEYIAELSEAFIKERGAFTIALSNCGSLIPFLRKLREAPYNKIVEWAKWHVFWADERVVSKSHSDSNYKVAKEFLSKVPIVRGHVHSINDTVAADQAAEDYEFVIRQLVRTRVISVSETDDCPRFDLIMLGMGPDGHVASLFPDNSVLDEKEHWVTFITDSPEPPPERITFTLPVINSAANVAVIIAGSSKAEAAHIAIDEIDPAGPELPARMVQPIKGNLVWFLDTAAASNLKSANFFELG